MPRQLSRFVCHRLQQYQYLKPRKSQLKYRLPLKSTQPYTIELDSPAHIGPHSAAIDYIIPPDTPVLAAADGQVIEAVDQYSIPPFLRITGSYWPTRIFRGQMNYLTLRHQPAETQEFSFYGHLKKDSFKVKLNQKVKAGQVIAQTGWSGWLDRPHLHFVVYTEDVKQFKKETHESLTPKWQNPS
jgi:murein DD-endopeptidase MepM/ murein hydrolase activator NlpD